MRIFALWTVDELGDGDISGLYMSKEGAIAAGKDTIRMECEKNNISDMDDILLEFSRYEWAEGFCGIEEMEVYE